MSKDMQQGGGEVCETCDGAGHVVTYADPYDRGDVSSPEQSPCPTCTAPPSAPVGVEEWQCRCGLRGPHSSFVAHADCPLRPAHALAQQPAAVDENWRQNAAEWLQAKAVEQEANNQRWPDHAAAYKEWRDRPWVLRYLAAQVLATQHQEPTT